MTKATSRASVRATAPNVRSASVRVAMSGVSRRNRSEARPGLQNAWIQRSTCPPICRSPSTMALAGTWRRRASRVLRSRRPTAGRCRSATNPCAGPSSSSRTRARACLDDPLPPVGTPSPAREAARPKRAASAILTRNSTNWVPACLVSASNHPTTNAKWPNDSTCPSRSSPTMTTGSERRCGCRRSPSDTRNSFDASPSSPGEDAS